MTGFLSGFVCVLGMTSALGQALSNDTPVNIGLMVTIIGAVIWLTNRLNKVQAGQMMLHADNAKMRRMQRTEFAILRMLINHSGMPPEIKHNAHQLIDNTLADQSSADLTKES